MNRNLFLGLGVMSIALVSALAQTPAPSAPAGPVGKIHGHVTSVTGFPANNGSISLSTDGGPTSKFTFPVDAHGDYKGEAAPGSYTLVYRAPDTKPGQWVDSVKGIKIVVDQDVAADDDMSRAEFINALSPEQKKQLEEIKKKNSEAVNANKVINAINADLKTVEQDLKDADGAREAAHTALGASASRSDLEAKENEIRAAKFGEVEALMQKDSGLKPDVSILWSRLCKGQIGLKKYDEAEASCKKALEVDQAAKKPNLQWQSVTQAELGELYSRTGKVDQAYAAYDESVKDDPTQAALNLKNEAVIFSQVGNADAQAVAADKAIAADPKQPLPYYLKGQALIGKATVDANGHYVFPTGCLEAYQKYLEVAPTGSYAAEVKGILAQFQTKVETTYKAPKSGKGK